MSDKLYTDTTIQEKILGSLLVNYTEMFRDPGFFLSLRVNVLPFLSTFPKICIWHAGCATGEEVYSLAILLDELKLFDRCEIYATDINKVNLQKAAAGIYPLQRMQESATRYFGSGGKSNLSDYYTAFYDHVIFQNRLRERIRFMTHDMVAEEPMKRFHLILCRNVFIYFNSQQIEAISAKLLAKLDPAGSLVLGVSESLQGMNLAIETVGPSVYQARSGAGKQNPLALPTYARASDKVLEILCVDDSSTIHALLGAVLTSEHGFRIKHKAMNGEETLLGNDPLRNM